MSYAERHIAGTDISWLQAEKILPTRSGGEPAGAANWKRPSRRCSRDSSRRPRICRRGYVRCCGSCAQSALAEHGHLIADEREVRAELYARLPRTPAGDGASAAATA